MADISPVDFFGFGYIINELKKKPTALDGCWKLARTIFRFGRRGEKRVIVNYCFGASCTLFHDSIWSGHLSRVVSSRWTRDKEGRLFCSSLLCTRRGVVEVDAFDKDRCLWGKELIPEKVFSCPHPVVYYAWVWQCLVCLFSCPSVCTESWCPHRIPSYATTS